MKNAGKIIKIILLIIPVLAIGIYAYTIWNYQTVRISEKPSDGTTTDQPFARGTGGSENFRIPGIVTLADGTLVAVCDARWNHTADSAGLDTIVSISQDSGSIWQYTYANYLGDNGNRKDLSSTCIIDPAIGTDGETIYLIADLFPAGYATNSSRYNPSAGGVGFDEEGRLLLRKKNKTGAPFGGLTYHKKAHKADYDYYMDYTDESRTVYQIYEQKTGKPIDGIEVDLWFNITYKDKRGNEKTTHLFYGDSPYQVFPTDYLYMTTSQDGMNWSAPTLLNLKTEEEATLLVGPGNGTYHEENGHMIFTAYRHTPKETEDTCLIWRDKDGNWKRTEYLSQSAWCSEASAVVLADGTVRVFYRNESPCITYTDFRYDTETGNYQVVEENRHITTFARKTKNCQLSAIRYSRQIDGKDAIIVATAAGQEKARVDGNIYVFLLEPDNSMNLVSTHHFNKGYFAYNCITELANGNIGMLWESEAGEITYTEIPMTTVIDIN